MPGEAQATDNKRICVLPPRYAVRFEIGRNPVAQLKQAQIAAEFVAVPYTRGNLQGEILSSESQSIAVLPKTARFDRPPIEPTLLTETGRAPTPAKITKATWVPGTEFLGSPDLERSRVICEAVRRSWEDGFHFIEEGVGKDGSPRNGLRPPQTGGLHAAIGHWKMSEEPATIVMPTGTGKTETMVALTVHERPERVLVVVPSDVLRTQISEKFLTLGLLKSFSVCGPSTLYPVVGTLKHAMKSPAELRRFLESCNVIVSTMSLLSRLSEEEHTICATSCSHLFVDEAHHVKARTWDRLRGFFAARRVLQFTATPFCNDGQHVDGRVIFNYPLQKAQAENYFAPITLLPVYEFDPDDADDALAKAAVQQLTEDRAAGHDHLLLARTSSIIQAERLLAIYEKHATQFGPVVVHSDLSVRARQERLDRITNRTSCVVVCVDMFGEGFDLPELKIAALHDTHKSLAVTLQFVGRFTRGKPTLGAATVIVNLADPAVDDSVRELYAEGSDWNKVLRDLSRDATNEHAERQDFLEGFVVTKQKIPTQNLTPKMSTVVYRTKCKKWHPHRLANLFAEEAILSGPAINAAKNVAYLVTRESHEIEWGAVREFVNTAYELYLLYWDEKRELLFVHTSNNEVAHESLAKIVAGTDAELVNGTAVFRVFSGLHRLLLQTLGLTHAVGRLIRFTMLVGADIHSGLAESQTQTKVKTNVFASGFRTGQRVTIGCSRKGRIWSRRSAGGIVEWVDWCADIGSKLSDRNFSENDILNNSIVPEEIAHRPALIPLAVEWPDAIYGKDDAMFYVDFGLERIAFYDVGLELLTHDEISPIRFRLFSGKYSTEYELRYKTNGAEYVLINGVDLSIVIGKRTKLVREWFTANPPVVRFERDSFTEDNQFCRPAQLRVVPFDPQRIQAWQWDGTALNHESQTLAKLTDSIQYKVIQWLKSPSAPLAYDIIFDDDDTREAADIVAIAQRDDFLIVHLFHCKYSKIEPGKRTADLFVVCGQAQLSVQWRANPEQLLSHLMHRDIERVKRTGVTRFEKGDRKALLQLQRRSRKLLPQWEVTIIQPGLQRGAATPRQLELLGATELYLMETYQIPFHVIASA
jgi:superfamily II DNA or RNA helicase